MKGRSNKILETLSYFDIFDYPLTKKEIWQFLSEKISLEKFLKYKIKDQHIDNLKGFYFIKKRQKTVLLRKRREIESNLKMKKAIKIISILRFIPTVKLIGISGALSMRNCERKDDIDFFVICKNNLVWTTRLLIILVLSIYGLYRRRGETDVADKICLNFLIGSRNLRFGKKYRNIYIAHEIAQLVPILDKNDTYEKFIKENIWISNFFPNVFYRISNYKILFKAQENYLENFIATVLRISNVEAITKFSQIFYMRKGITREIIKANFIALHPIDFQQIILSKLYKNRKV